MVKGDVVNILICRSMTGLCIHLSRQSCKHMVGVCISVHVPQQLFRTLGASVLTNYFCYLATCVTVSYI